MRYVALLLGGLLFALPARAQFVVEDARPQHGSEGVALSSEVAFAFSEEISVSTDWNTAFLFEPRDALSYNQVSLCLNFEGQCDGGNDVPRFVRFNAEHEPDTDYTWMVYAVETAGGDAMDAPFVLRYTTAPTIGQQDVAGAV
ncbi:MAG: T9SS C-terminal target domain-containing protein, partial [Bacteroidetes bacterium]|nr:T9SS C-terminal target domain-containing protein [Bacteroidota bacterium]